MAKYYVSCGPMQEVCDAATAEQAALMALDGFFDAHRWVYDDAGLTDRCRRDHLALEALLHLEPEIRVSQRGFGRGDAAQLGTPEVLDQWHRLMSSIARLWAAVRPPQAALAVAER